MVLLALSTLPRRDIWHHLPFHFLIFRGLSRSYGCLGKVITGLSVVFYHLINTFRINLGIISLSMIAMLLSYLAQTLVCLSVGTVFEDAQCAQLKLDLYLNMVHRHTEMLSLISQLSFTIERVLSVQFSQLHSSKMFKIAFVLAFLFENGFSASYMYSVTFYSESWWERLQNSKFRIL